MKIPASAMLCTAAIAIAGCPVGGGVNYSVGGTVTGLVGSGLVLQNNSGSDLHVDLNGGFSFGGGVENGGAYSVTVKSQPSNPAQFCTVRNASGTIDKADVANVLVACTQTGRFAFVANQVSNTISAYIINSADGALSEINGAPFAATGTMPTALIVHPDGQFLFVANNTSNNVSVFAINPASGALTAAGIPSPAGTGPGAIIIDPTGRFLYVANLASDNVSAYSIDGSSGALTEILNSPFPVGAEPASLKVDPNGNFLYVTNFSGANVVVLAINFASGALQNIAGSPFATGSGPLSVAIDPTNAYAYVANEAAGTIAEFSLNASTGALTAVSGSPIGAGSNPESLAVDPAGRYVYAANVNAANHVATYSLAPTTGVLTLLATVAAGALPIDLVVDPSGQFIYVANYNSDDISAYRVDAATGVLTPVGGSPFAAGIQPHAIAID